MVARTLRIRPARASDCAALAHIQVDSYRTAYAGLLPEAWLARFSEDEQERDWHELLAAGHEQPLVAVLATDELAGYVLSRLQPADYPAYDAEFAALHVHRSCQRRGIGRALLGASAKELVDAGCRSALLSTLLGNPVAVWYERLGAQRLGERCWLADGTAVREIVYGWPHLAELHQRLAGNPFSA